MEKTIICKHWEKNECKFMEYPSKCLYAHGIEDIKKINCKYGIYCNNTKCLFYHGDSIISNMVYDISIVNKRKNKKNKKVKKSISVEDSKNLENTCNFNEDIVDCINGHKCENIPNDVNKDMVYCGDKGKVNSSSTVKIINKNNFINDTVNIYNVDNNRLLQIIDDFYIKKYNNMVYTKNINIENLNKINEDKSLIIKNLNSENNSLKKIINELKTENQNLKNINTINIPHQNNKIKSLYNKYISLYYIFNKYNNYKLINIDEIRKYTKDKNIYKVKQRAYKIYNFYQRYINGTIKDILPISKIIKMVF